MDQTEEPYFLPTPDPPHAHASEEYGGDDEPLRWGVPLTLFLLTLGSTFFVGALNRDTFPGAAYALARHQHQWTSVLALALRWVATGWSYAVPLLTILLCHEFGHYIMARRHRVSATLPMFIPVPMPPFGTLGAVIKMRGRIRTRNALLDIGAAGPLAGIIVALPVTYIGLRLSPIVPIVHQGAWTQEGTSILYALLKFLAKGPIDANHDVMLHPIANAGWVGMFVTMINLIPYGQLDGGHVAYALLGRIHDRFARWVVWGLLALGVGTGLYWGRLLAHEHRDPWTFGTGYTQGFNWFMFAFLIWLMHRGTQGRHPPTDPGALSSRRRVVAAITLALFVLLFMPVPLRMDVY
jgi:membrane-associated protease RseP (regulator of RpoE activity)